jgi:hypothetical protein
LFNRNRIYRKTHGCTRFILRRFWPHHFHLLVPDSPTLWTGINIIFPDESWLFLICWVTLGCKLMRQFQVLISILGRNQQKAVTDAKISIRPLAPLKF